MVIKIIMLIAAVLNLLSVVLNLTAAMRYTKYKHELETQETYSKKLLEILELCGRQHF